MFLDDNGPKTLEDVLANQADTATTGIEQQYAKKRRRAVGQQAAAGRLSSGVANYSLGDIDAGELGDIGGVQSNLAQALGQIPVSDYGSQQEDARSRELAILLAEQLKPSRLEEIFGGIGAATKLGGSIAAFI